MIIKTQAGQQIEFRQKIDNFGWELWIQYDGTEIAFEITDEEMKWIKLDLEHRV